MSKFHYQDKVMIIGGIHADKIGEIRAESANNDAFLGFLFGGNSWLVYVDYPNGKWDIDWIPERYLQSLEEIEESTPHPEYLKWDT